MDPIPLLIASLAAFAIAAGLGAIRGFRLDNLLLGALGLTLMLAAISWPAVAAPGDEAVKVAVAALAGGLSTFALERERVRKSTASRQTASGSRYSP